MTRGDLFALAERRDWYVVLVPEGESHEVYRRRLVSGGGWDWERCSRRFRDPDDLRGRCWRALALRAAAIETGYLAEVMEEARVWAPGRRRKS